MTARHRESPPVDACSDAVLDAVAETVRTILGGARFLVAGCSNGGYLAAEMYGGNVTVVAGRRDRVAGYLDQFGALRRYGCGNFVALGNAGHYLPFEEPERFASITRDWPAQCERSM